MAASLLVYLLRGSALIFRYRAAKSPRDASASASRITSINVEPGL